MNNKDSIHYDDWYVLQTITNKEFEVKDKINKIFDKQFNMLIPLRELLHTRTGNLVKKIYPLFPGYIFLHNDIDSFIYETVNIKLKQFIKPVCFNNEPAKIRPEEMKYLYSITNEDGIVPLSKGIFHNDDNVEILYGPLKDFKGTIIFINKKKHKAKVRINMFNREVDTILGLKIIEVH